MGDDALPGLQEVAGDPDAGRKQAALVAPQVQDQSGHALALHPIQGLFQFVGSPLPEAGQVEVGGAVFEQQAGGNRRPRDHVPHELDVDPPVQALPRQAEADRRPGRPFESARNFLDWQPAHRAAVDHLDRVARPDAGLECRRLGEWEVDDCLVAEIDDLYADARIASALLLAHGKEVLGVKER